MGAAGALDIDHARQSLSTCPHKVGQTSLHASNLQTGREREPYVGSNRHGTLKAHQDKKLVQMIRHCKGNKAENTAFGSREPLSCSATPSTALAFRPGLSGSDV
ncbi:unnamed protein product [Effrenium voratum]|nr:unnamed protein product [Effrenium voratum]